MKEEPFDPEEYIRELEGNYKIPQHRKNFIRYLKETLIPDLEASGQIELANDFKTCITYMS